MSTPAHWKRFSPGYAPLSGETNRLDGTGLLLISRGGGDFLGFHLSKNGDHTPDAGSVGFPWISRKIENLPVDPDFTIGTLGDRTVYLKTMAEGAAAPDGCEWANLRSFIAEVDKGTYEAVARAGMLSSWYREHRFCGRCGSGTQPDPAEHAMVCPSCGLRSYPRVTPAMIVRITDGDHILLARNQRFPEGLYSCVAGYVDPGENLEMTIRREVEEEVNLEVRRVRYFSSQSWPFPHSLMIAFTATASAEIDPVPDGEEIVDARWFSRDTLPQLPMPGSISRRMVDAWIRGGSSS